MRDTEDAMADDNSRVLQAMIDAAANLSATPSATGQSDTGESDMDFEPTSEEDEEIRHAFFEQLLETGEDDDEGEDDEEDEEEEEDEDDDGTEHAFGGEIEVVIEEPTAEMTAEDTERIARQRRNIIRLLQNTDVGRLFRFATHAGELDDDEDDDSDFNPRWRRRRRPKPDPNRFPKVPSDEGTLLMNSGAFGSNEAQAVTSDDVQNITKKKKLAMRILDRELAIESPAKRRLNNRLMAQDMLPSSQADMIVHYDQPVYSGQFSDDGNFFFSANKDYRVRMYDTTNPYRWRYYKTVEYPFGQWTLTDASLSPDNKYLAYTSIRSTVCLAPTDPQDQGDPYILDLSDRGDGRPMGGRQRFGGSFGIWSIRYSGDGRELVAGTTGGSIVVYDIESRRSLHRIFGHDEDVNAVCFADKLSPHILYSGSDDTTLKVWDTRSMGDSRAAGAFVGHIEGITYIDSKGDGRYVLSNGKDQSMKLWDLRMVMPSGEFERIKPQRRATTDNHFDYRWGTYDEDDWYKDPFDNSVVTFRGHKVLRTLIRCHFSPAASTNSRYVYSGSEDGKVYIWNMDATLAGTVDVRAATLNSRPRRRYNLRGGWGEDEDDDPMHSQWKTCVRDVSWHPNAPMIVASAWNGYGMSTGTCSVHSWNDGAEDDEGEMGLRVDQQLRSDPDFYRKTEAPFVGQRRVS